MKKKVSADHISTLLGVGTSIEGTLTFADTIRLDGSVKGKIVSKEGTLIVGERAVLDAHIQVKTAIVKGTVSGPIHATEKIEAYAPAKITGDIQAATISIESGVRLNGNCRMNNSGSPPERKNPAEVTESDKKVK